MIIKRKYETYGVLCNRDPEAKKVICKYLTHLPEGMSKDEAINEQLDGIFVYRSDMGSGVRELNKLLEELDELDEKSPYENGLTYRDASKVVTLPSRRGNAILEIFVMDNAEVNPRIVNIVALENVDGVDRIIPPWNIDGVRF